MTQAHYALQTLLEQLSTPRKIVNRSDWEDAVCVGNEVRVAPEVPSMQRLRDLSRMLGPLGPSTSKLRASVKKPARGVCPDADTVQESGPKYNP